MKKIFCFLIGVFILFTSLFAQKSRGPKMHDVFLEYLTQKINITQAEAIQIRPLIIGYFAEIRNNNITAIDPLLKDKQRVAIKLKYRELLKPVLGDARATRFFTEEQLFRKKIREELRTRNVKKI